ncbi:hypothetical protein [Mucilaginibacter polytrichastri]|uniref:Uncharacterized protein n=1 Tax=Mucilaginibacter polytrichastri TaxID=1302689 RepID=A0A1Q6A5F8_9SPHI|nr:hypothetical protein [Mucilaginibacter polytrichastri]OKS89233.1 hypothetical protein RG47T_4716 [Mucilaginibacter polytrichastri]SFS98389.1 hypothetical protein SAMN04487890_107271 [Mucilaginibacter polytrichastri]
MESDTPKQLGMLKTKQIAGFTSDENLQVSLEKLIKRVDELEIEKSKHNQLKLKAAIDYASSFEANKLPTWGEIHQLLKKLEN